MQNQLHCNTSTYLHFLQRKKNVKKNKRKNQNTKNWFERLTSIFFIIQTVLSVDEYTILCL